MDRETKELLDEICSLGDNPNVAVAIAECVRMALDDRDRLIAELEASAATDSREENAKLRQALAAANALIGEVADEAKRLQDRLDQLEAER